jgi:hypothetical protein
LTVKQLHILENNYPFFTFLSYRAPPKPKKTLDKDVINYLPSIGTISKAFGQGKLGPVQKHKLSALSVISIARVDRIRTN